MSQLLHNFRLLSSLASLSHFRMPQAIQIVFPQSKNGKRACFALGYEIMAIVWLFLSVHAISFVFIYTNKHTYIGTGKCRELKCIHIHNFI